MYCGHRLFTLPAFRVAEVPVKTMSDLRAGSIGGPDRRMYKPAIPCPRTEWLEQGEPVPLSLWQEIYTSPRILLQDEKVESFMKNDYVLLKANETTRWSPIHATTPSIALLTDQLKPTIGFFFLTSSLGPCYFFKPLSHWIPRPIVTCLEWTLVNLQMSFPHYVKRPHDIVITLGCLTDL